MCLEWKSVLAVHISARIVIIVAPLITPIYEQKMKKYEVWDVNIFVDRRDYISDRMSAESRVIKYDFEKRLICHVNVSCGRFARRMSLHKQVNPVPRAIRANLTTGIVSRRYCVREIIIKYKWIKFMVEVHVRAPSMHFIVVFRVKPFTRLCAPEEAACVSLPSCDNKFFESLIKITPPIRACIHVSSLNQIIKFLSFFGDGCAVRYDSEI